MTPGSEEPDSPHRSLSRRRFLAGLGAAGGVAALGGIAFGIDQWVSSSPPWPAGTVAAFRSRPDLQPPTVTVTVPADDTAPGSVFLAPSSGGGQYGPMIVDNQGQPIWFRPVSGPWPADTKGLGKPVATNFRTGTYRGRPVLTWWQGVIVLPGYGIGNYVVLDDRYRHVAVVEAGNGKRGDLHEFFLTPDGTAIFTWYEAVPADLSAVGGPAQGTLLNSGFQELDIATGDVIFEWSAKRFISFNESYNSVAGQGTQAVPWDFFHINSVDVGPDGNYLISARHTWAVYKIDRSTGAVLWRLNGKQSDFRMGPQAKFSWQHDARWQPDGGLSLFDDAAGVFTTSPRARGLLLALDESARTAGMTQEYVQPGPVLVASQGSVQMQPNGDAFVGWGSEPYLSEFAHDGRLLFSAQLPQNGVSYRAFRFPWSARPESPPDVALVRNGGTDVYVSWNGATAVSAWQVLTGGTADALRPLTRVPRRGFETAITGVQVGSQDQFLAVAALDARSRELARSKTLTL